MKLNRTRPLALALSLAAAAVVFGADTTPKKKPAEAKPAAKPAEAKPAAAAPAATAPAAAAKPAAAKEDEVVATVDGESIKRSEVEASIREVMAQRGMPPDALPEAQLAGAMRMMLDNLVTERIIKKASAGVTVSDAEIAGELENIRKSNNITDTDIAKQLAAAGKTMDSLKTDIRNGMQQKKWFADQLKDKVKDATEADAKEFYDKNPQHFSQPEMVRASHILFRLDAKATPEQEAAAMKKAEAAIGRAKTEDFAKLAGELSEEPGAKERGGDLDFFPRQGAMVEPFAEAAYGLKKDEVTQKPVRTQFGIHVIKATDKKEATMQPFAEAKEKITGYLNNQKKQAAAGELVASLREKAKVEIKLPAPPPAPALPPGALPPGAAPKGAAAPAPANRKPVEAVTPPVSVPPEPPKK
jgi:parvulin-like peptidyl-prolyl isomerase